MTGLVMTIFSFNYLKGINLFDKSRYFLVVYDRLFNVPAPDQDKDVDFKSHVNPESLTVIKAFVEPSLKTAKPFDNLQFQRLGYFVVDPDSIEKELVFNKTVGLRDTWAKQNN